MFRMGVDQVTQTEMPETLNLQVFLERFQCGRYNDIWKQGNRGRRNRSGYLTPQGTMRSEGNQWVPWIELEYSWPLLISSQWQVEQLFLGYKLSWGMSPWGDGGHSVGFLFSQCSSYSFKAPNPSQSPHSEWAQVYKFIFTFNLLLW